MFQHPLYGFMHCNRLSVSCRICFSVIVSTPSIRVQVLQRTFSRVRFAVFRLVSPVRKSNWWPPYPMVCEIRTNAMSMLGRYRPRFRYFHILFLATPHTASQLPCDSRPASAGGGPDRGFREYAPSLPATADCLYTPHRRKSEALPV